MYIHSRIGSDGRSTQLRIRGLAFGGLIKFSVWGIKNIGPRSFAGRTRLDPLVQSLLCPHNNDAFC